MVPVLSLAHLNSRLVWKHFALSRKEGPNNTCRFSTGMLFVTSTLIMQDVFGRVVLIATVHFAEYEQKAVTLVVEGSVQPANHTPVQRWYVTGSRGGCL